MASPLFGSCHGFRIGFPPENQSDGFTLIELITVISIIALLATLAGPSFANTIARMRVKSAATDIVIALTKARSEAIKRNSSVNLSAKSGGWQNGWQITDPANTSIILDDHAAVPAGVTISNSATSVVYRSSGRITVASGVSFQIGSSTVNRFVCVDSSGRPYTKELAC